MKVVFCGTPQFVVTQPDRPQGRGMELTAPPVKQAAVKLGLPVVQPEKIKNNQEFREQLIRLCPDAIIVVGYGRIIPPWMLELPPRGNINVHGSLLPKYRGAAPIQWAIASGETVTGVTTMLLDQGLDTGAILLQREMPIQPDDTAVTLAPRMAAIGADLLVETLRGLEQGTVRPVPQENSLSSLAPILKKEDGHVDFSRTAAEICDRLRGFQPWPGSYTQFRGRNLKIIAARPAQEQSSLRSGELQSLGGKLFVGCGAGSSLELLQVQLEGKKAVSAHDFSLGQRPAPGERLG
jgi:methionyl-tRNA formyltransferase